MIGPVPHRFSPHEFMQQHDDQVKCLDVLFKLKFLTGISGNLLTGSDIWYKLL